MHSTVSKGVILVGQFKSIELIIVGNFIICLQAFPVINTHAVEALAERDIINRTGVVALITP